MHSTLSSNAACRGAINEVERGSERGDRVGRERGCEKVLPHRVGWSRKEAERESRIDVVLQRQAMTHFSVRLARTRAKNSKGGAVIGFRGLGGLREQAWTEEASQTWENYLVFDIHHSPLCSTPTTRHTTAVLHPCSLMSLPTSHQAATLPWWQRARSAWDSSRQTDTPAWPSK